MTLIERIFALKNIPGFDQLRDDEILSVAAIMTERAYGPGETVAAAGSSMWHLFVVVSGGLRQRNSGWALPAIVGTDLLLTQRPVPVTIIADETSGAVCLRLSKPHFFTIVTECPVLLVEIARMRVIVEWFEQT